MTTATVPIARKRAASVPELLGKESKRRRRRQVFWILAALAFAVLVASAVLFLRPQPIAFEARFRTVAATRGDVVREVRATGHLEAESTVDVGAEVSGRIASVLVDFNDPVKKGQLLARFDVSALTAQHAQAEATLAAATAALEQAKLDRDQSALELERSDGLFAQGIETPAQHDATRTAAALAKARVRAAESQVAAASAARDLAATNLAHSEVRSPIDGIVISRDVDPGQTVVSALQTPVLFVVAADLTKMRVLAAVDEADVAQVRSGQSVEFTVTAFGDRRFAGVVREVRNAPAVVQDVVTYATEIEVANPDLALKPGMTASVRIRTGSAAGVMRVPAAALRFVPPDAAETPPDGRAVWVLGDGRLERVAVAPGISDGELTAVEGGLAEGARVVVDLTPEGKKANGR